MIIGVGHVTWLLCGFQRLIQILRETFSLGPNFCYSLPVFPANVEEICISSLGKIVFHPDKVALSSYQELLTSTMYYVSITKCVSSLWTCNFTIMVIFHSLLSFLFYFKSCCFLAHGRIHDSSWSHCIINYSEITINARKSSGFVLERKGFWFFFSFSLQKIDMQNRWEKREAEKDREGRKEKWKGKKKKTTKSFWGK